MLNQYPDFDVKHFMSTFETERLNGYDVMIMQSTQDREILMDFIKKYENEIEKGHTAKEILNWALANKKINPDNLLDTDLYEILEWIEKNYT